MKKKLKSKRAPSGMIPSQNAMRYVWHQLCAMRHKAEKDAIVYERVGDKEGALSLRLQAHDMWQVAKFMEERIIPPKGDKTP